jgi:hypothetical protein
VGSFQRVSQWLSSSGFHPLPASPMLPSPPVSPRSASPLQQPDQLFHSRPALTGIPAKGTISALPSGTISTTGSARQQLTQLGQKYGVNYTAGQSLETYQKRVIQQIVRVKAREHGIPEAIALAISKNESGQQMWKNVSAGTLVEGRNIREGQLLSTDWGAMQINDKAHPGAFPRAKTDLEYNIDYGLAYLARQRDRVQGSLNLGFGDWDRTIASYNLGHNPGTERAYAIAERYVSHVRQQVQDDV